MVDKNIVIANNITIKLEENGKEQIDLAKALNISRRKVSKMLSGKKLISAVELGRIAEFLKVPVNELMANPEEVSDDNVVRAFMGKVESKSVKKTLKIVDELADLVIFHARKRENTESSMSVVEDGNMHGIHKVLENRRNFQNSEKFEEIQNITRKLADKYSGSNIVQDDIFRIIENYTGREGRPLELFRIPVDNEEIYACAFLRRDRIFVVVNSQMILVKQIFAAACELYHIYCYLKRKDSKFSRHGSIIIPSSMNGEEIGTEDMEANIFAGLFLASSDKIREQMDIYKISKENISFEDILLFVDIFAIPYQEMILRLYEEKYIDESKVCEFFDIAESEISKLISLTDKGKRWYRVPTDEISFGSLMANFEMNKELEALDEKRKKKDEKRIAKLRKMLDSKRHKKMKENNRNIFWKRLCLMFDGLGFKIFTGLIIVYMFVFAMKFAHEKLDLPIAYLSLLILVLSMIRSRYEKERIYVYGIYIIVGLLIGLLVGVIDLNRGFLIPCEEFITRVISVFALTMSVINELGVVLRYDEKRIKDIIASLDRRR